MKKQKKKTLTVISSVLLALTVLLGVAIPITNYYSTMINAALGAETQKIIPGENSKIFYWTEYESEEDLVQHDMDVCRMLEEEGAVLLLNKDGTLPLAADTKFSLFSQSAAAPVLTGTGSAFMSTGDAVSFYAALENSFEKGCINTDLWKFYKTAGYKRENAKLSGGSPDQYRINEVPWEKYPEALKNTFEKYGDCALIVLSRSSGEGADLPSGLDALKEYMTDGDYLRLCKEEADLFENICLLKQEGVFKKIVVLLNSSSTLQLDFIDKYDIDAVLWVGNLGLNGIPGVTDILSGKINPSGRIVDTFLKDNHASPAMQNYAAFPYTNADEYGLEFAQNNTAPGIEKCNKNYVVYQEGIYVGYRYFETRYEDRVLNQGNAGNYDYASEVAFPFGYGLSYTDFEYSNFNLSENDDGDFTVTVDVKNTGSVDGKHTVQIYFQSPYTDYDRANLVEKASVELCGFDKKTISAGSTEKYTINIKKDDLTSYDSNGARTYILDAGDYYFTVGTDAHNAINNILLAKGAEQDKLYGTGDSSLVAKWTNPELDTITFSVSSYTGNAITNLFDNADLNKYDGAEGQTITYLSRKDWIGTFPSTQTLYVTEKMWNDGLTHEEEGRADIAEKMKKAFWDNSSIPDKSVSGELKAIDLTGASYTDTRWDDLVSQIEYSEMLDLIYNGAYGTRAIPSINLPATQHADGPTGFTKSLMAGNSGMAFTSEDVMAATFNMDLIEEVGKCIGEDMMHANKGSNASAMCEIYAPGANIHRSQYLGRHNEYYSEDGWLSGEICAAEVVGIRSKGVLPNVKHFALNDQEEGRYGISVWCNEQAIRELYLEPFEGAVRGGAMNIMSSFNRIGVVWSGAHYGLMTGILRNEWGMEGSTVTDMALNAQYMDCRLGILAGQDIWLGQKGSMGTLDNTENDPAISSAVHRAVKNIVYSVTNTNAMNIGDATVVSVTPWWQVALIAAVCVSGALTIISFAILFIKKKKQS